MKRTWLYFILFIFIANHLYSDELLSYSCVGTFALNIEKTIYMNYSAKLSFNENIMFFYQNDNCDIFDSFHGEIELRNYFNSTIMEKGYFGIFSGIEGFHIKESCYPLFIYGLKIGYKKTLMKYSGWYFESRLVVEPIFLIIGYNTSSKIKEDIPINYLSLFRIGLNLSVDFALY